MASVEVIADNYAMIEAILPIPKKPSKIPNAKPPITEKPTPRKIKKSKPQNSPNSKGKTDLSDLPFFLA